MEVREALFGQEVERQCCANRVGNPLGLGPELRTNSSGHLSGSGPRSSEGNHSSRFRSCDSMSTANVALEVVEDLDLGGDFARRIGGDAHGVLRCGGQESRDKTSHQR